MNARNIKRAALVFMAAGLIAAATPSAAFRMSSAAGAVPCNAPGGFNHWNAPKNIPLYLNTTGQGAGKAVALWNAAAAWNGPAVEHQVYYAGTTTAGFATDARNTVIFQSGNGCSGSCLAITALTLQAGQVIVEADISFNPAFTWNTNGSDYDAQAMMTHEIGHALGIAHTNVTSTPRPTMYALYFGTGGRTLENDDLLAIQCAESVY